MANKGVYIPKINPIPLYEIGKIPLCSYNQKFNLSDKTAIQLVSVDIKYNITCDIYKSNGLLVATLLPSISEIKGVNTFTFYTFDISFSGYKEGSYYLQVNFSGKVGITCSYQSPCIELRESHDGTFLAEYKNTENKFDVNFVDQLTFRVRVEGGFLIKNYSPKSNDNVYQSQTNDFVLLHSSPYSTAKLTVGGRKGIPDWMHDIIHRAFSCNKLTIEGVKYNKYIDATWEPVEVEAYPLRTWRIELVKSGDNVSDPISCIKLNTTCTFEWTNDGVCQVSTICTLNPTNNISGDFEQGALDKDGKLYLVGLRSGIWYLDTDGVVKDTNMSNSGYNFYSVALGSDNKLYFGAENDLWYLDDYGQITQLNIGNTGIWNICTVQNKTFLNSNEGTYLFDGTTATKISDDHFSDATLAANNKIYFATDNGVKYLDDNMLVPTNKNDGWFISSVLGPDNKLYFLSYSEEGIWYLDTDGDIKPTNITSGYFQSWAKDNNGDLFFLGGIDGVRGIWILSNGSILLKYDLGDISPYRLTIGRNDVLFMFDSVPYLYYTDNGKIMETNRVDMGFVNSYFYSKDGVLYVSGPDSHYGTPGLWYVTSQQVNTGNFARYKGVLKIYEDNELISSVNYNILDAFGSYPAITEDEYSKLSNTDIYKRSVDFFATIDNCIDFTVINEQIVVSESCGGIVERYVLLGQPDQFYISDNTIAIKAD